MPSRPSAEMGISQSVLVSVQLPGFSGELPTLTCVLAMGAAPPATHTAAVKVRSSSVNPVPISSLKLLNLHGILRGLRRMLPGRKHGRDQSVGKLAVLWEFFH